MTTTPYAGFWRRAIAFVLDSILAALPPAILCLPFLFWQSNKIQTLDEHLLAALLIYFVWQVLGFLCLWLYFASLESSAKQATWGKRLMKIKVVDKNGQRIRFARASGRFFAKILSSITFYVGFIMAGLMNRKRALHDYVAETYVVRQDFQPGDDLPDTPSHPVWLGVVIGVMALFFLFALSLSIAANHPAARANQVAFQLQTLAENGTMPYGSLEADDVSFSRLTSGYRAVFTANNGKDYSLYLPQGEETVCCESYPGVNCADIGFAECE